MHALDALGNAQRRDILLALRGGMTDWPEHTLLGYRLAVQSAGAEVIDLDIRVTADGVLVVIHDERVDRTTDGTGFVSEMTLAELKDLDAGFRFTSDGGQTYPYRGQGLTIPTLEEVLAEVDGVGELGGGTPFLNIELKVTGQAVEAQLLALVRRYTLLQRTCVGALEGGAAARLKREEPEICTFHSQPSTLCFGLDGMTAGTAGLCPEHDVLEMPAPILLGPLGPTFIQQAFEVGIPVIAVDPADEDAIAELLDRGVDGILARDPALAAAVIAGE